AAGESSWLESSNYLQERRLLAVDQADLYQDSGRKSSGLLETGTESRDVGNRVLGYTRELIFLSWFPGLLGSRVATGSTSPTPETPRETASTSPPRRPCRSLPLSGTVQHRLTEQASDTPHPCPWPL